MRYLEWAIAILATGTLAACAGVSSDPTTSGAGETASTSAAITAEDASTTDSERMIREFVGTHLIYTYENGWKYEIYVRNDHSFDYRIHSGIVGGRWVNQQEAQILRLAPAVYKISWDEPTGTIVSLGINLVSRRLHGAIFFPRWVADHPERTILHQNEYIDLMLYYRDQGPTYPKLFLDEFADIKVVENCGPDRDEVISCPPSGLPADFGTPRPWKRYCSVPCAVRDAGATP